MFKKILVPVDLGHLDRLQKALAVAAAEAGHHAASVVYMGVTEETPGAVAHNPKEYEAKLADFAAEQAKAHGITAEGLAVVSTDPAAEINKLILKAVKDTGADLVVMASHPPRMLDWILPSHGGHVAEHAEISVFVIR
ncbi:universal stress protein [Paracoccus salsus]|uniref:universal stress protein n=1 Tax=Paracoccus salsus TaxID=2911061 RepID=UPI001F34E982|nr:universal stress protein [Paracoccus salsus]MCF3972322.1 universal stress protein [Paracoccus salsus]